MKRKRICDATVEILRETNNPGVMWGDSGLLDMIAARAGVTIGPGYRLFHHDRILNALSRQPGILLKKYTLLGNNRRVRAFRLPEPAA